MLNDDTRGKAGPRGTEVIRASLVYVVMFSASGFGQPYFPIWLSTRQLSDTEIAVVLSAPMLLRTLIAPALGSAADRAKYRSSIVRMLAPIVFLLALALSQARGFWMVFIVSATMMVLSQSIPPIVDASVLTLIRQGIARDFGRIRLWGSVSFAVASIVGGFVLASSGPDAVFGAFLASTACLGAALFLCHRRRRDPGEKATPPCACFNDQRSWSSSLQRPSSSPATPRSIALDQFTCARQVTRIGRSDCFGHWRPVPRWRCSGPVHFSLDYSVPMVLCCLPPVPPCAAGA